MPSSASSSRPGTAGAARPGSGTTTSDDAEAFWSLLQRSQQSDQTGDDKRARGGECNDDEFGARGRGGGSSLALTHGCDGVALGGNPATGLRCQQRLAAVAVDDEGGADDGSEFSRSQLPTTHDSDDESGAPIVDAMPRGGGGSTRPRRGGRRRGGRGARRPDRRLGRRRLTSILQELRALKHFCSIDDAPRDGGGDGAPLADAGGADATRRGPGAAAAWSWSASRPPSSRASSRVAARTGGGDAE